MCSICGCGEGQVKIEGAKEHSHAHDNGHEHDNGHNHEHDHAHQHGGHDHHYGKGAAHAHAPGMSQSRMVQIETDIMAKNNEYAGANRKYFSDNGILALNLVSSPGSGKTTLLTKTINDLKAELDLSVIEGDQQTTNDADRIRETGAPAIQVNTGKGCHLDGHMIGHALETLAPKKASTLFIENVGNLVCPAGFDLGEAHKVAILSVTEGEDKPLKYPDMFYAADIMLLNKIDLLPHLNFDVDKCIAFAKQVNPKIKIFQVSATTGEGMENWYQWIKANREIAMIDMNAMASKDETQATIASNG